MIGIADYGLGNVAAFEVAYQRLGLPTLRVRVEADFENIDRIILPGVGAFDTALERLRSSGLSEPLIKYVTNGMPLLGVCVGMQMLANASDEGSASGLALVPGRVRRFEVHNQGRGEIRSPHMGWNSVQAAVQEPMLEGIDGQKFYFLHSYFFECDAAEDVCGTTQYGIKFSSLVRRKNIVGAQFHPEKSHDAGLRLLSNFSGLEI